MYPDAEKDISKLEMLYCRLANNYHTHAHHGRPSTETIIERLEALKPVIEQICAVAGTPGISVGVSFQGKPIFNTSYGLRDVESSLPVTSETIFPLGTLAKTFTASAVGKLVDQGKIKWTTPISSVLPELSSTSPTVTQNLTIVDLLCQRSGLGRSNYWWQGAEGALLLEKKDLIRFYNTLPATGSFRADWAYSNWGYALAGEVIERLSGMTYAEYVQKFVLEPLQLQSTTFKAIDTGTASNLAKPYAALDDSTPFLLSPPPVNDNTIMCPAMGGASSAADLLTYSMALLEAHQSESGLTQGATEPILKNALMHLSGHIFTTKSLLEKSYAFGFYRSQLPSTVLGMGWNSIYVKNMPKLIPRGHCGPVIAHGGSLPGYHTSMALLPEIMSSIVVSTNSIALGDVSGWVSLAIIETLIDTPQASDFVSLATEAAGNNVKNVDKFKVSLEASKTANTPARPFGEYVGRYEDTKHDWIIEIRRKDAHALEVAFQGLESQVWLLTHFESDTFLWLASREEQAKRSRMTTYPLVADHFKLIFKTNENGIIDRLCWPHEAGVPVDQQSFLKVVR